MVYGAKKYAEICICVKVANKQGIYGTKKSRAESTRLKGTKETIHALNRGQEL